MTDIILFSSEEPSFYLLSQIFDSRTNPSATIIPRPNSLVLDVVNNGLLQRVVSVDPTTFNTTYGAVYTALLQPTVPSLDTDDTSNVSIVDYGNTRFYMYYDQSETPTKINIDKKVILLGDDVSMYDIQKWVEASQSYVPISLYYDTDGTYRGTKSPFVEIGSASNAKVPTNCNTTEPMKDDDIYFMFIYDYSGTQCGSFKLFAKKAIINNDLADNLLIEDFTLESTQMNSDGFYIFPGQNPQSLVITPRVILNDGSNRIVPIDEKVCYLYGLEGYVAAYPGQTVELLVKYFLAAQQQAVGPTVNSSGSTKYLMKSVSLIVKDPGFDQYTVKILAVPIYLPSTSRWSLTFFLYTLGSNTVQNVTSLVSVSPAFNGLMMGTNQVLMLSLNLKDVFPDAANNFIYNQPLVIQIAPYAYYQRYMLSDSPGDDWGVYGVDSPILPRPVLYFDSTVNVYFIPTSKFSTSTLMLEAFYYKMRPLYDSSWLTTPVTPTHFTIRHGVTGVLLLSAPIPITGFGQSFSLVNVIQQNQLLGTNCIVEFLSYENNVYNVLFGAPVDVYPGTYTS